ncbi:MAG: DUF1566 domain-containing protein [Nitrospira sp.]|nr:DUF1566 domain-containing protein [Nitrospira sp.]
MQSRRTRWLSGLGAVVLIGGLVLANAGTGVAQVEATSNQSQNPFKKILKKLDEILAKLNGGGGQDGNHTLRWDQNLPAAERFVVLASFANAAVLDKETGLVWEQSPLTTEHDWNSARVQCADRTTGGRKGWRLPSVHELASLVDLAGGASGPTLPPGHPFLNVQADVYWSASTDAGVADIAWIVNFFSGSTRTLSKVASSDNRAWCVRGGHNDGSEY